MMAKKIKSYKDADVWYTKDKHGVEEWTVLHKDNVCKFDNELAALTHANPKMPDLKIVEIDEQIMLHPSKGVMGDDVE